MVGFGTEGVDLRTCCAMARLGRRLEWGLKEVGMASGIPHRASRRHPSLSSTRRAIMKPLLSPLPGLMSGLSSSKSSSTPASSSERGESAVLSAETLSPVENGMPTLLYRSPELFEESVLLVGFFRNLGRHGSPLNLQKSHTPGVSVGMHFLFLSLHPTHCGMIRN